MEIESMTRRAGQLLASVVGVLAAGVVPAESHPPDYGVSTLHAVCVQIEAYDDVPIARWQAELEEATQKQLAKAGVPIVAGAECFTKPTNASLFFSLHGTRSRSGKLVGYHVRVGLTEQGTLVRAPGLTMPRVTTWENWVSGVCETADLKEVLGQAVAKLAAGFAGMYKDAKAVAVSNHPARRRSGRFGLALPLQTAQRARQAAPERNATSERVQRARQSSGRPAQARFATYGHG